MPQFSKSSKAKLSTCVQPLIDLFYEVIKTHDITILEGYRSREEQEADYAKGVSKAKWGQSKHNAQPSQAVDVAPCSYDSRGKMYIAWEDGKRFDDLATFVMQTAKDMNIGIRWGGNFTTICDKPHYELKPEIL